jgi:hypothetical protein
VPTYGADWGWAVSRAWVERQRREGKIHVDNPGEIRWFAGEGPATVIGLCPHHECRHHAQSVIAWGPDYHRYELVQCDVDEHCAGGCRAWTEGDQYASTDWLQVEVSAR